MRARTRRGAGPVGIGVRLNTRGASRSWLLLCAALGAPALALMSLHWTALAPPALLQQLDWQPAAGASLGWRVWTAAWVHWSGMHLAANGLGLLLVAWLGQAAGCGRRDAWAWLVAWPLSHLALLLQPALQHYGGLSGVLHAGVAIAALRLIAQDGRVRRVGVGLLSGLLVKLLLEQPWGEPLRHWPGWDIAIAPLAHTTGVLCGLSSASLLRCWRNSGRL